MHRHILAINTNETHMLQVTTRIFLEVALRNLPVIHRGNIDAEQNTTNLKRAASKDVCLISKKTAQYVVIHTPNHSHNTNNTFNLT